MNDANNVLSPKTIAAVFLKVTENRSFWELVAPALFCNKKQTKKQKQKQ